MCCIKMLLFSFINLPDLDAQAKSLFSEVKRLLKKAKQEFTDTNYAWRFNSFSEAYTDDTNWC